VEGNQESIIDMKIFFCETFDDGTVGGSHACMYNLIRNMDRKDFQFTAGFYSENVYSKKCRDLDIQVIIVPKSRPFKEGNAILRKVRNWYNTEHLLEKYLLRYFELEQFDLVVMNNSIYVSLPYLRVCKKLKIPLITYERGIGWFEKRHIRATADVQAAIPVSHAVHDFLRRYGYRAKIIETIYDGIEPSAIIVQRHSYEVKARLGIPVKSRVLGIIGNVRPWKGQRYFVDAFLKLAGQYNDLYGLVIGGSADEDMSYLTKLRQTVLAAGLQQRILFLGYRSDVSDLLSILDVFVHASIKPEPFGMVILESMAAKVPVVASNLGGPKEILNNGSCGILVPPKDADAIAEACRNYLEHAMLQRMMTEAAYKRVKTKFHISQTIENTAKLFRKVCESYEKRF
jgi:glycosyltransferase involved in cell wall biosynthesis